MPLRKLAPLVRRWQPVPLFQGELDPDLIELHPHAHRNATERAAKVDLDVHSYDPPFICDRNKPLSRGLSLCLNVHKAVRQRSGTSLGKNQSSREATGPYPRVKEGWR